MRVKVSSSNNLMALAAEQPVPLANRTKSKVEHEYNQNLGSNLGFDLSQIESHYNHRRMLRRDRMVFRYGELAALRCMREVEGSNEPQFVENVLSFARYTLMETALVAINVSDQS